MESKEREEENIYRDLMRQEIVAVDMVALHMDEQSKRQKSSTIAANPRGAIRLCTNSTSGFAATPSRRHPCWTVVGSFQLRLPWDKEAY